MNIIERAKKVMPGGINTCIRNYPENFSTSKAEGAYFWDQNGKRYIDYLGAWGPIIIGYDYKPVKEKVKAAIDKYDLYGIGVTEPEVELAEKVCKYVKGVERLLVCNGGSEATYHAIRCARAWTGREKIIKFQGLFHGWHDFVLMNVVSDPENMYKPDYFSAGMLKDAADKTLICHLNNLDNVRETVQKNKGEVAAIIVDPFCTTFGCMRLEKEFINGLRQICDEEGMLLIFDEVVTGFRVGLGGATAYYDVTPDLVCMGKAIANGYPIAALGGKAEIMDTFNTTNTGVVSYQATYYGNPAIVAAAVATLEELEKPGFYEYNAEIGDMLCKGLEEAADRVGMDFYTENAGSLIGLYFGKGPNKNYEELVKNIDWDVSNNFRRKMIDKGYYMAIGPYKRIVTFHAHTKEDIAETVQAAEDTFKEVAKK